MSSTMNSSSTLVATVSINYEDFTEGFLTCGTCLCAYDQAEHSPKLLSCSHTICQSCLELIASSPTLNNSTEAGCIKCPICRQNILIPSGGVGALPPSFLVNQLFDLVNKKPREFIPKCSVHIEQELLFCETCDCVFCDNCNNNTCNNNTNNESDDSLTTSGSLASNTGPASLATISTSHTAASSLYAGASGRPGGGGGAQGGGSKRHISEACTVIPFSTAIKRMSEILHYRSQQCSGKLEDARDNVQKEVDKLEVNCADTERDIGLAFEQLRALVNERERRLLEESRKLHEYKKDVLLEQLEAIEVEQAGLAANSSLRINNETDVKNLSKKIADLAQKNDLAQALHTPRENCFICFEGEQQPGPALEAVRRLVDQYGRLKTSKTYPPYCTSRLLHYSANLRSAALVQSVDYAGQRQSLGGDPIQAELRLLGPQQQASEEVAAEIEIADRHDGTYEVSFVPPSAGKYQLFIYILGRPIKDCPLQFETSAHHNPVAVYGASSTSGARKGATADFDTFSQPASLAVNKHNGRVYILDSFNNRIKVLAQLDSAECPFSFMQHIQPDFFAGRSCTGIALLYPDEPAEPAPMQALGLSPSKAPSPSLLVSDWRARTVYELNTDGKLLRQYSHEQLQEPTNLVVDARGRLLVVDRDSIFVFSPAGKLLRRLTGYSLGRPASDGAQVERHEHDSSSIKKEEPAQAAPKAPPAKQPPARPQQQAGSGQRWQAQDKENGAKPAAYLADKRAKSGTLSSLMSMKRKPRLSPASSLQRGSKAVMSAASRIRSTFTLSHSSSLVSAASLQSMFHGNKQAGVHGSQTMPHLPDGQPEGAKRPPPPPPAAKANKAIEQQHQQTAPDNQFIDEPLPEEPAAEDTASPLHHHSQQHQHQHQDQYRQHQHHRQPNNQHQQQQQQPASLQQQQQQQQQLELQPFGIIRAIAAGPDHELVLADETCVRVLQPTDQGYAFKRDLQLGPRPGHAHAHQLDQARLCAMTYDPASRLLLVLRSSAANPHIQVVDYQTGRAKFTIDSHDSRLLRPSGLATYGQHVLATDLGNDCIKKYRFY